MTAQQYKVDFVFFDAGGGHRAAANALKAIVEQQQLPWRVRLVNLQETLDELDIFRKLTRIRMQDIYNKLLEHGWTLGSEYLVPPMHWIIRLYHNPCARMLGDFWRKDTPDMVVSVVPNFNRAILQGLRRASATAPYVTILTDMADYPPHFWIERQEQYLICGTERAVEQAKSMGHGPGNIYRTSGMILRPSFYERPPLDRAAERAKLGLDPQLPTGIVLFGGQGSRVMLKIAQRLNESGLKVQLILVCGRNERLAARLRALERRIPMHVVGFTSEVPYFMRLSDFFIGKPGPGSISEALAMHLPVIVERNAWTLPQERFNTEFVRDTGTGLVLSSFDGIAQAVQELLGGKLDTFRANAARMDNRAVFEIPEILKEILGRHAK